MIYSLQTISKAMHLKILLHYHFLAFLVCLFLFFLPTKQIDPLSRSTLMAGSDHCFRTCCPSIRPFPLFKIQQNKPDFKRKQCSLLARLWVWPSGSLMTPTLCHFTLENIYTSPKIACAEFEFCLVSRDRSNLESANIISFPGPTIDKTHKNCTYPNKTSAGAA